MRPNPGRMLLDRFPGKVVRAGQLSDAGFMALYWYMAVDGEAWENVLEDAQTDSEACLKRKLKQQLPELRRRHGEYRIGITQVSMQALRDVIMGACTEVRDRFRTFARYHEWYKETNPTPGYKRNAAMWPVILDTDGSDVLQDGWHRFHRYYQLGRQRIPALYYP